MPNAASNAMFNGVDQRAPNVAAVARTHAHPLLDGDSANRNTRRVLLADRFVSRDEWPSVEGGRPLSGPRPAPVPR